MKKSCVQCFKVLADDTRLRILDSIQKEGGSNVSAITHKVRVTQPTVSHHLRRLLDVGLLRKEERGKEILYAFNPDYPCKGCGVFTAGIRM